MKLAPLASLFILLCALDCFGQAAGAIRIASVGPYPNAEFVRIRLATAHAEAKQ